MRCSFVLVAATVTLAGATRCRWIQAQAAAPVTQQAKPNPNAEPETILLWPETARRARSVRRMEIGRP